MAVGVGTGFDISKFTDALKKADTALTNLVDKQNQLSRVTMNAFKQMSEQGVVPYVESLKKQVSLFDSVKASITDASGKAIKGFGWMKTNIVDATNELNKLINALEKTKQFRGETSGKTAISYANKILGARGDKSIDNMEKALQQLEAAQNRQNLRTKTGQKNYENLAETIRRVKNELDKATGSSEKMNKSVGEIGKSHKSLLDISGQLQRRLALVFSVSQITGYINKLVRVRGEFELQQKALQAIVQNIDEANILWDKTVALAVKSPFRVKELVTYTKQLAAYRIETSKLYDTTKRLADVSAGLGVDMNRLILAYGQVRAANFLRGTELRQFTEAGIPMLEELASYFSELEGRAISVSEVFERISKRMVTFKDVSAVFQRMTNEGGVFYDMQAKQSETLKGQISNLHDSIDLMINDIGKSNNSLLKNLIGTTRTLVENWKSFATAIEEVGVAFSLLHLSRFALGLKIAAAGHTALAISMKGSIAAGAKFDKMMKTLFSTIKANPIITFSGVILTALYSLHKYNKAIDEANEKYNEMSRREVRRINSLKELNEKVLENNKAIKDNKKSVEEQNEAINDNNSILLKIKKDYPDLYDAVIKQKDGTIDLTGAIKIQNEELRTNIALQQQAKGGFWQESQGENYEEAVKAQQEYYSSLENLKSKAVDLGYQLEWAFKKGEISEESYNRFKKYLEIIEKAKDVSEIAKTEQVLNITPYGSNKSYVTTQKTPFESILGSEEDRELISQFYYNIEQVVDNASRANMKYASSLKDLWGNFEKQISTFSIELNKLGNSEDRGKWLQEQLSNLNIVDEKIQELVRTKLVKKLEIDITFPKDNQGDGIESDDWVIRVKSAIEEINEKIKKENKNIPENWLFPIPEAGQTKEQYLNSVKPALEAAKAVYREGQKIEDESAIEKTNALKPYADAIENILNIQDKSKNNDNDALQRLKEQIRLVRELAKDYQKLWDEQGKDVADASIWSKERIAAFRKAGLDYEKFEVGGEGDEVKNLQKLTDISGELYKAIADARTELGSFKQQLKDAEFARYLDELFGNYEVSLELEKLNIPPDLAKRLFGVESIDLNSIRKEILNKAGLGDMQGMTNEAIFSSERYLKLNKEQRKIVEDGLKKEDELQQKALEERLKRYSQFLVKGQSERVRIKIEELRELAKLEEDYQSKRIEKTDYELAKKGIQDEYKRKQQDLVWDEFTESDTYIKMFEDLDKASTSSIRKMINRIEDLKGSISDLDPKNVKELIDALEKLKDEDLERNPFRAMSENAKEWVQWLTQAIRLNKELKNAEKKEKESQRVLSDNEDKYSKAQADYERISKDKNATDNQKKAAKDALDMYKTAYQSAKAGAESAEETAKKARITKEELRDAALLFASGLSGASSKVKEYTDALSNLASHFSKDAGEFISGVGGGISSILGGAGSLASGNPLLMIQGASDIIGGIKNIKGTFDALHDKKNEREIQSQIELVDKLGKQYEKLEKQIDKAYSLDTLQESYQAGEENLKQQIASYDSMIAAEEGKKNTDDNRIKEWKEAQEKLQEQIEELRAQAFNEATGGILDDVKSAAREWTDAWFEAFAETGNGLDGLKDHFKENMLEMVKQQASMLITGTYLDDWKKKLEDYVNADDMRLETDEAKEWADYVTKSFPELNAALEAFATSMEQAGVNIKGTGELSGLQRGIQGITEEQSDILASYLNSIRLYVSQNTEHLSKIAASFDTSIENPMLPQLRIIATQTTAIRDLLDNVTINGGAAAFNVRLLNE